MEVLAFLFVALVLLSCLGLCAAMGMAKIQAQRNARERDFGNASFFYDEVEDKEAVQKAAA